MTCSQIIWYGHTIPLGTQFLYDYKSLVVSGVPSLSKDGIGQRFEMTLAFTQVETCWLVLNVINVTVYRFRGNWLEVSEEDYFLDPSLTATYNEALTRYPLWHRIEEGAMNCLRWHPDEQLWIRNFKRGLLASMQMRNKPDYWETHVAGKCRVKQTIDDREDEIIVTKVYDMSSCIGRQTRVAYASAGVKLSPQKDPLSSQMYSVSMSSKTNVGKFENVGLLSKFVVVDEKHEFKPFGRFEGGHTVFARKEYTLRPSSIKLVAVPEPPSEICDSQCSSIPFEMRTYDDNICIPMMDIQVNRMLTYLYYNWDHPEQINFGESFIYFVYLLRRSCLKQIHTVWSELHGAGETKKLEIFLDALSDVDTDHSVKFLTEKILSGSFTTRRVSSILSSANLYNTTTPSMLKQLLKLAKVDWYRLFPDENPEFVKDLFYQSWLLLGSAIRSVDDVEPQNIARTESVDFLIKKLRKLLVEEISDAHNDIKAVLDAMANAEDLNTYDSLMEVISQAKMPSEILRTAILALKGLIPWKYDTIQESMAVILNDSTVASEARTAAWDVFVETYSWNYPTTLDRLMDIVQNLNNETDLHFCSYVFSWLLDWADHAEADEHRAQIAQLALYSTGAIYWGQKFRYGYLKSKYEVNSWSPLSSGEFVVSVILKSVFKDDHSTVPYTAAAGIDIYLFGQHIPVLEIEGEESGVDWMLEYLFGRVGYFATDKSWNLTSKFQFNMSDLPEPPQMWKGSLTVSIYGKKIGLWSRDHKYFTKLMEESALYNLMNSLWWIFHDTGYKTTDQPCFPWTIESPLCHKKTGWTWPNFVDVLQRWREVVGLWKMFSSDGTIWERTFNMDMTVIPLEIDLRYPSCTGLTMYAVGRVTAHIDIETTGSVALPTNLATEAWPQSVWNHLCAIWNVLTDQPQEFIWKANINPKVAVGLSVAVGMGEDSSGSGMQLEIDVTSNHNFRFNGSAEQDTFAMTYDISQPNTTLASYKSRLTMLFWDNLIFNSSPVVGELPIEKDYECTPKEFVGAELCLQYEYYDSSEIDWAPLYPLNGHSSVSLSLLSYDSFYEPCLDCYSYSNTNNSCKFSYSPSSITARITKNDVDKFTVTVEGDEAMPRRKIRMDYLRERNINEQRDWITTDISWNIEGCSYNLETPQIQTGLQWKWDRVDINAWARGKGFNWELDSMTWLNRTYFVSKSTFWNYEETNDQCLWIKPEVPHVLIVNGYLVDRTRGSFYLELQDTCKVKHWIDASISVNQLFATISANSSYLDESDFEYGLPLPRPIDTASCHVFGYNFITFDRLHYATEMNDGSYILAHDALHNNFTVLIHKDGRDPDFMMEVWIAGTRYNLRQSKVLYVNGTRVRLPYKSCAVNVIVWELPCGKSYLRLRSRVGLEIYFKPEAAEVSVDGFYYRRMRGLCGNNNNKINQEWQKPDSTLAETPEEFVDSWKTEGYPSVPVKTQYSDKTYSVCKEAFMSRSLEPVSHEMDLNKFFQSCLVEVENSKNEWTGVCRAFEGIKVAAFARDFPPPLGCRYGDWLGWKRHPDNNKIDYRIRKLMVGDSCDTCCPSEVDNCCPSEETEYRSTTGMEPDYCECEPLMFQYVTKWSAERTCVSTAIYPTCHVDCFSIFGNTESTEFICHSTGPYSETPVNMPYEPVIKCVCPTDCLNATLGLSQSKIDVSE
jgi:hypothetical protein